MTKSFLLILVLLPISIGKPRAATAPNASAITEDIRQYNTGTIDERARLMLDYLRNSPDAFKNSVPAAEVYLKSGKNAEGNAILREVMAPMIEFMKKRLAAHAVNASANGFVLLDLLTCYVHEHDHWSPEAREDLKWIVANNRGWKGTTSNLSLVMTLCLFLSDHIYGPDTLVKPGVPYLEGGPRFGPRGDKAVIPFLEKRIEYIARNGSGEFASQPYMTHNIEPLLILDNPYTSKELGRKARIAYEVSLAHAAGTWLRGHLGVSSGRSYPDCLSQEPRGSLGMLWFYFGGIPPGNSILKDGKSVFIPATAPVAVAADSFRPSDIIVEAATERDKPYVCRSEFNGLGEFQYSYVNRKYILFSSNVCHWGQTYPYGVMWDEPDVRKISNLWITVPCADADTFGLHAHGVNSRAAEFLQEKDALLMVANHLQTQPPLPYPYAEGMIPDGEKAIIDHSATDGRIFLNYGSVLIAVSCSQPFAWDRESGRHDPSAPRNGSASLFRIKGNNIAMAIETAPPDSYPGATASDQLKAFAAEIEKNTKIEIGEKSTGTNATASYTDRLGNKLEKTFKGAALVNGKLPEDYDHWPLLDNPWMHQERNGNLTITDGHIRRIYDVTNWTVTDTPATPGQDLNSASAPSKNQ